jgi:hypothetical protein
LRLHGGRNARSRSPVLLIRGGDTTIEAHALIVDSSFPELDKAWLDGLAHAAFETGKAIRLILDNLREPRVFVEDAIPALLAPRVPVGLALARPALLVIAFRLALDQRALTGGFLGEGRFRLAAIKDRSGQRIQRIALLVRLDDLEVILGRRRRVLTDARGLGRAKAALRRRAIVVDLDLIAWC